MDGPYRGSCLCGDVRFEADAFDGPVGHCHCSMCRKFHGAAYATLAGVKRSQFRPLSGADALQHYTAANGTTRTFCKRCGSSLVFHSPKASPDLVELALATFDDPVPVSPSAHIFVASGVAWDTVDGTLPRFTQGRGSEEAGA